MPSIEKSTPNMALIENHPESLFPDLLRNALPAVLNMRDWMAPILQQNFPGQQKNSSSRELFLFVYDAIERQLDVWFPGGLDESQALRMAAVCIVIASEQELDENLGRLFAA